MMKNIRTTILLLSVFSIATISLFTACSNNDSDNLLDETTITQTDKNALLFMLEEEKLARDTYQYLDDLWSINQFANIKLSEQSHMNSIALLLDSNNVSYTILPSGEFTNQDLQNFYNQFIINGSLDQVSALIVGATIEDLDIVDLQNYIDATENTTIISVFESLQCGSRNHLRSFVSALQVTASNYTPQFLTQEEYNLIINNSNEQCNK